MSRREDVLEGLIEFRAGAKGAPSIMVTMRDLILLLDAAIEELRLPASSGTQGLIESLKVALEHPTTEARVLLGRLLTELERRST